MRGREPWCQTVFARHREGEQLCPVWNEIHDNADVEVVATGAETVLKAGVGNQEPSKFAICNTQSVDVHRVMLARVIDSDGQKTSTSSSELTSPQEGSVHGSSGVVAS